MISSVKLDFWINHNYNVLMVGKHGIGKTAIITEAFNRNNLKWKYFSAATMDPWVDFIGVPKEKEDPNGNYLELVRPLEFQRDEIEALFFDEFSRAPKKVRNAVMELIQFKSINGKKFNNLRIIWAAINPDDDKEIKYDVETLDPAQADRFHIKIDLPYSPFLPYFNSSYGKKTARAAIDWWKKLPEEMKKEVSPRRLDYALNVYSKDGDIRDVLPKQSNAFKLITEIKNGSINSKLKMIYKNKDEKEAKIFLSSENNYASSIEDIIKSDKHMSFFFPFIDKEKIISLLSKNKTVFDFIAKNSEKYKELLIDIIEANQNKVLVKKICKRLAYCGSKLPPKEIFDCVVNNKARCRYYKTISKDQFDEILKKVEKKSLETSYSRKSIYLDIRTNLSYDIDIDQSIKTLQILSSIISKSYSWTFVKSNTYYPYFIKIINYCFYVLHKNGKSDLRDINHEYSLSALINFALEHYKNDFYFKFEIKV